jgi:hypothetical protein
LKQGQLQKLAVKIGACGRPHAEIGVGVNVAHEERFGHYAAPQKIAPDKENFVMMLNYSARTARAEVQRPLEKTDDRISFPGNQVLIIGASVDVVRAMIDGAIQEKVKIEIQDAHIRL